MSYYSFIYSFITLTISHPPFQLVGSSSSSCQTKHMGLILGSFTSLPPTFNPLRECVSFTFIIYPESQLFLISAITMVQANHPSLGCFLSFYPYGTVYSQHSHLNDCIKRNSCPSPFKILHRPLLTLNNTNALTRL